MVIGIIVLAVVAVLVDVVGILPVLLLVALLFLVMSASGDELRRLCGSEHIRSVCSQSRHLSYLNDVSKA